MLAFYRLARCIFENIRTDSKGAGFLIIDVKYNLSVYKCSFIYCITSDTQGGGGFFACAKSVDMQCCNFDWCFAPDQGCAFYISDVVMNTTILSTTVSNSFDFQQDGFFKNGINVDSFCHGNASHISGKCFIFSNHTPESKTTSIYKFFNAFDSRANEQGLFFSRDSPITIEKSNTVNCSSPYFLSFHVENGMISILNCIFSKSIFSSIYLSYDGLNPILNIHDNTYDSVNILMVFGESSGQVIDSPHTYSIKYCSNEKYVATEIRTVKRIIAFFSLITHIDLFSNIDSESFFF